MDGKALTTQQKALALNLNASTYGTFAEIGGGQEVAHWFSSTGGPEGIVAKTFAAWDMTCSEGRHVPIESCGSRQWLEIILEQEFAQLRDRIQGERSGRKCLFAFADTGVTDDRPDTGNGSGWMGLRFQARPHDEPSQIILRGHLFDATAAGAQEAVGVLGVNLIHGAFFRSGDPAELIDSLMDELSSERIEIDMVRLSGPAFQKIDNLILTLQLAARGLEPVIIEEQLFSIGPGGTPGQYRRASWVTCAWGVGRCAERTPCLR